MPNGDKVRWLIIQSGATLTEMARILGVSKSDISHATSPRWRAKRYGKLRQRIRKLAHKLLNRKLRQLALKYNIEPREPVQEEIAHPLLRQYHIERANNYALAHYMRPLPPIIPLIARLFGVSRTTVHLSLDPEKTKRYRLNEKTAGRIRRFFARIVARPDIWHYD